MFTIEALTAETNEQLRQPLRMTEEEFLEFCDEDTKAEHIDGEVIVLSPGSNKHSRIATFLTRILQFYIDRHHLGTLWGENFQVRPRQGLRRVSDLIFISKDNRVTVTNTEGR
ncbi:MAG: Uma2 family endonuclease [candidate division KSB1 bacterium]|nr:Uma2 family endonuclease [candidate division KSB1 bacterium]